jgi:hypothetical protein
MTHHDITPQEYMFAIDAGRQAADIEFRAQTVTYLRNVDAIEVLTIRGGGFVIPRLLIGVLHDVDPDHLGEMTLWPDGSLIEIEDLDIHLSVDGMIKAALPVLVPSHIVAGLFAASGGAAKSAAKARSSRENGKKGGRPKKAAA